MPFAKRLVEKAGACAIAALLAYFFQSDETLVDNTFALFLVPFPFAPMNQNYRHFAGLSMPSHPLSISRRDRGDHPDSRRMAQAATSQP
ncbi:hypothetical protein H6G97_30310 [Nostoc flagelliforme FACHB-838]|uniref:Uncharacterized protein n=1 Tax=Nostoc flagelliforme FACHB-838 TaxID=2692904 RepID=A0ABR8DWL8_9NOSO|nr:hypothetical protein [Nostoc flagelliforme]MBD2533618.1 hypothetical protein [Nostoc flagelliforme FACHB-838]